MLSTEKRAQVFRYAWEIIERAVDEIRFGSITMIIQDGYILQLEKNEKIRLDSANLQAQPEKSKPSKKIDKAGLQGRILSAVKELQYGQVTILIKEGAVVQLERTTKQRFANMQGVYGEGI